MLWETVTDSCDVLQCTRLFKNVFKIKNTPESLVKTQATKSRRLLSMASRRLTSPELSLPSVDKENGSALCSSLTLNSSPQKLGNFMKPRCPLEDCDPNSQDSGYEASYSDEMIKSQDAFRFAEPLGTAPRKMSIDLTRGSPLQSPVASSPQRVRRAKKSLIKKLSSSGYESMDDGFNELNDMDYMENSQILPNGLNYLLSGQIVSSSEKPMECDAATTPEFARTKPHHILRRSLSLQNEKDDICSTPPLSKIRACLFRSPNASSSASKLSFDENPRSIFPLPDSSPKRSFKRPEPPTNACPVQVKRSKRSCSMREFPDSSPTEECKSGVFQRSFSETEAHANIKSAIHRSTTDADLTGDFSKTCILPLAEGHHDDLKSISSETLARLMRGDYHKDIAFFQIVDCRYPYEYEAGHIEGAVNLYTKDLIETHLMQPLTQIPKIQPDSSKRNIIVFHCEFSWERGPNLSRYLRNIDRKLNKEVYPALHYPEIYILHGGYKQFFRGQKELCSPQGYRPMNHPDHDADLRKFRSKSKSWQGEKTRPTALPARANLKRLGF